MDGDKTPHVESEESYEQTTGAWPSGAHAP